LYACQRFELGAQSHDIFDAFGFGRLVQYFFSELFIHSGMIMKNGKGKMKK